MSKDVIICLADAYVHVLTDWQLQNLWRHRLSKFCCGRYAWLFWAKPDRFAPELLANTPGKATIPKIVPVHVCTTYRNLCRVSGKIRSAYIADSCDKLYEPLTRYSYAIERATDGDVRRAIGLAVERRRLEQ